MASLPLDTLKQLIIQRAGKLEICDNVHEVLAATTYEELLSAGCRLYVWVYQTDVVDDDILATEFTDEQLALYGIYKTEVTLTNPDPANYLGCKGPFLMIEEAPSLGQELYFVTGGDFTLNVSGQNKTTVHAMGEVTGTINMTENAKINLKIYNTANVTVNLQDTNILCVMLDHESQSTINSSGMAVTHGEARFKTSISYTAGNTSFGKFTLYAKANINHNVTFPGFIEILKFNQATENVLLP